MLARATSYMGSQTYVQQPATKESDAGEKTPLLGAEFKSSPDEVEVKQPKKKEPSLFLTLTKCYGWTLAQAHLCKLVCDILTFVGPTLQR